MVSEELRNRHREVLSDPLTGVSAGPTVTPLRVILPGTQAVFSRAFDINGLQRRTLDPSTVESALVVDTLTMPFKKDDFVETTLDGSTAKTVTRIAADAVQSGPHQFFLRLTPSSIAAKFTSAALYNREVPQVFTGTVVTDSATETEITLEVPDQFAHTPGKVVVEPVVAGATLSVRDVASINPSPNPTSMKIQPGFGTLTAGDDDPVPVRQARRGRTRRDSAVHRCAPAGCRRRLDRGCEWRAGRRRTPIAEPGEGRAPCGSGD